jgi:hypothetical protein
VFRTDAYLNEAFITTLDEFLWRAERRDLSDTIRQIIESMMHYGTDGKAVPPVPTPGTTGRVNVIPGSGRALCQDVLIAFCFDGDSFNSRIREVIYHGGIDCPDTRVVILITSQWNAREWHKNHSGAFEKLSARKAIFFAGFGHLTRLDE